MEVTTSPEDRFAIQDLLARYAWALDTGDYEEIILSTLPSHVSHWLHVDLPGRVAQLGYPLTTITPASAPRSAAAVRRALPREPVAERS